MFFRAVVPPLGLGSSATPVAAYVAFGVVLGPRFLGVLSADVLSHLDAVVSVALAVFGLFAGFGLGAMSRRKSAGLLVGATVEATLTMAVVAVTMFVLVRRWVVPLPLDAGTFAILLGLCACASGAVRVSKSARAQIRQAVRIAELDDVPLILLGSFAVALVSSSGATVAHLLMTAAGATMVAIAAWLLVGRARTDAEHGVFVTGAIVLLGGIGASLGTSPLLKGLVAALIWQRAPGSVDAIIQSDLRKLQHPFVALLFIVAGAAVQWTLALLWIAAPLLLFRLTGKLVAAAVTARLTGVPAVLLSAVLVPPSAIGIALALNIQQVIGDRETLLLSAVTLAATVSELLATTMELDRHNAEEH